MHTPTRFGLDEANAAIDGVPPEAQLARAQELTEALVSMAGPLARMTAEELISAIMDLYCEGLARVSEVPDRGGDTTAPVPAGLIAMGD